MPEIIKVLGGGSLLHQVVREITTKLDRRFASFGVTTQQAALLLGAAGGGSSPGQLMTVVGTDTAGMTKLLDRLEAKGLIRRCPNPDDRRSVLVEPTDHGLSLVPELQPVFGEVTSQLFEGFSDEEVASFTSSLRRMRENLQS
jgi:DNA-binding MarR family transcriptional regulator